MSDKAKWVIGLIAVLAVAASAYLGIKLPEQDYEAPAGAALQVYDLDVGGTLNYGSQNLYPIGNAVSGKEFSFGTSLTPVAIMTVPASAHALATVTFADCVPVTQVATGAWSCRAQVGASNQLTLTLLTLSATPVPTQSYGGIRWQAAGN